ncbi:MAG: methylated-DNA--[protein]-cysteine S-methyltransferase [Gemmatimonadota bacterium]
MRPPRIRRAPRGHPADPGRSRRLPGRRGRGLTPIPVYSAHLSGTPLGTIRLWATDRGIRRLDFRSGPDLALPDERISTGPPPSHLATALQSLREYIDGRRRTFHVPLDLGPVTPFRQRVYDYLQEIPYGYVATYGDIARHVADGPESARAVGQAVGSNPVAILIPCHRVVSSEGRLHGFGGGLERKSFLLRLEGVEVEGSTPSSKVHPEVLRLPF